MKILSKTRDYYDNAAGYDSDDSVLFVREHKEIDVFEEDVYEFLYDSKNIYHGSFRRFEYLEISFLLFCGKIYPIYYYPISWEKGPLGSTIINYKISYSCEEVLKNINYPKSKRYYEDKDRLKDKEKFYKDIEGKDVPIELFQQYNTAYYHIIFNNHRHDINTANIRINGKVLSGRSKIEINPNLNNLEFFQVFHPMECRQEIEMYLANVMTKPDIAPQRVGSDEIIAKQKGFDDQSFRTLAPGKKKLNRKKNRELKRARS